LIETEKTGLKAGNQKRSYFAAYDRFLQKDICKGNCKEEPKARWTFPNKEADLG